MNKLEQLKFNLREKQCPYFEEQELQALLEKITKMLQKQVMRDCC